MQYARIRQVIRQRNYFLLKAGSLLIILVCNKWIIALKRMGWPHVMPSLPIESSQEVLRKLQKETKQEMKIAAVSFNIVMKPLKFLPGKDKRRKRIRNLFLLC